MDISMPMSISPAAHLANSSYRRRMLFGSVGSLSRSLGGSMGRSLHDLYNYNFVARSPGIQSPGGEQGYYALLEDKFCKDFHCCGLNLENLHDLLQHFEECHVRVESDVEDDDDLPFDLDEMDTDLSDQESMIPVIRSQLAAAAQNQNVFGGDAYGDYRIVNNAGSSNSAFDTSVIRKRFPNNSSLSTGLRKNRQYEQTPATIPYILDGPTQVLSDTEMDECLSPTSSALLAAAAAGTLGKSFLMGESSISDEDDTPEIKHMFPPLPMSRAFEPHMLDIPKIVRSGGDGAEVEDKDDRPYKCKVAGCTKAYKNPGGLKYHMQHGHCEDTGDPEMNNIIHKPYQCPVPECGKRYKNLNGLKYHIEHSHISLVTSVAGAQQS